MQGLSKPTSRCSFQFYSLINHPENRVPLCLSQGMEKVEKEKGRLERDGQNGLGGFWLRGGRVVPGVAGWIVLDDV